MGYLSAWLRIKHGKRSITWRHNGRDGVSNHQPHDSLLNRLFKAQIKENIKSPRHWPLSGELTGEFPAQMASYAENVSIWWRHHDMHQPSVQYNTALDLYVGVQ